MKSQLMKQQKYILDSKKYKLSECKSNGKGEDQWECLVSGWMNHIQILRYIPKSNVCESEKEELEKENLLLAFLIPLALDRPFSPLKFFL